jgi:NAD(P)-dependent dehydrogenase (short-subunit alcohol dehydrogenase family)
VNELKGRVAVITGAASGIGKALAKSCLDEGMRVVIADIDGTAVSEQARRLKDRSTAIIAVQADVSVDTDVAALADTAFEAFGGVHLLCNNAGVGLRALAWEHTQQDWEWLLGVNLWGVVHALRAFLPRMLTQGDPGHVVNTGSIAGLLPGPFSSAYGATKSAVVSLSEALALDLEAVGADIGVSVLCPGFVRTDIVDADRARPTRLANPSPKAPSADELELEQRLRQGIAAGSPPDEIAAAVLDAVRHGRFWILPHPQYAERVRQRTAAILDQPPIGLEHKP